MAIPPLSSRTPRRSSASQSTSASASASSPFRAAPRLTLWVHDDALVPPVLLKPGALPGAQDGDLVRITLAASGTSRERDEFLFRVEPLPAEMGKKQPQLQISVHKSIARVFSFQNRSEVILTRIPPEATPEVQHVELSFQNAYMGRQDMWRFARTLNHLPIYVGQPITFASSLRATVTAIYLSGGRRARAGVCSPATRPVFRSRSSRYYVLLCVSREMWDFDEDGERYYEKAISGFLPELLEKWDKLGTSHMVTIVLFSRVTYDQTEAASYIDSAALRYDDNGQPYKDFFKVVLDLEINPHWPTVLARLRREFLSFQRDVLLLHHGEPNDGRIAGQISFAFSSCVLEAINLVLNGFDNHNSDRDLARTGLCMTVITPGTGHFDCSKALLRLITDRLLAHGVGVDIVSLAKMPLHSVPVFRYLSAPPELSEGVGALRRPAIAAAADEELDPLYADAGECANQEPSEFYNIPAWCWMSFYSKQRDKPFRAERFVPRCRAYELQALGIMDHDFASISIPFLEPPPPPTSASASPSASTAKPDLARKMVHDEYDANVFARVGPRAVRAESSGAGRAGAGTGAANDSDFDIDTPGTAPQGAKRPPPRTRRDTQLSPIDGGEGASTPISRTASVRSSAAAATVAAVSCRLPSGSTASPKPLPSETGSLAQPSPSETPAAISTASAEVVKTPAVTSPVSGSAAAQSLRAHMPAALTAAQQPPPQTQSAKSTLGSKLGAGWLLSAFRSSSSSAKTTPSKTPTTPAAPTPEPTLDPSPAAPSTTPSPASPAPSASPALAVPAPPAKPISIRPSVSVSVRTHDSVVAGSVYDMAGNRQTATAMLQHHAATIGSVDTAPGSFGGRSARERWFLEKEREKARHVSLNPSNPGRSRQAAVGRERQWHQIVPKPRHEYRMAWTSHLFPACLPLTVDDLPSRSQLLSHYQEHNWVLYPGAYSILVSARRTPAEHARAVLVEMASQRLAQGAQFVIASERAGEMGDDVLPIGAGDVLGPGQTVVWMSTTNQIHRLSYDLQEGTVSCQRFVKPRTYSTPPFEYDFLVLPPLRQGYELQTVRFNYPSTDAVDFNRLDSVIAGELEDLSDSLRYWRARFVVLPIDAPDGHHQEGSETLNDEELRLHGMDKLVELFGKARWLRPGEKASDFPRPRLVAIDCDPSACVLDETIVRQLEDLEAPALAVPSSTRRLGTSPEALAEIAAFMLEPGSGIVVERRRWHFRSYDDAFIGSEFVTFLVRQYRLDAPTREAAVKWGETLRRAGLFEHVLGAHSLLDGMYFYRLKVDSVLQCPMPGVEQEPRRQKPKRSSRGVPMSRKMIIDLDAHKRSDRTETAVLHYDSFHNAENAWSFQFHWLGITSHFVEETVQAWNRQIRKFGLRLAECKVDEIADIAAKNPFASCARIRLAVPPPPVPQEARFPSERQRALFFERAILRKFGFVLDAEAQSRYPPGVPVRWTFQRQPFTYDQFVHRSGFASVQIVGGEAGFLWLGNRLYISTQAASSRPGRPGAPREPAVQQQVLEMRNAFMKFCGNAQKLRAFYEEVIAGVMSHAQA